jgi:selenocysteine lyase/cysteine desulfurase
MAFSAWPSLRAHARLSLQPLGSGAPDDEKFWNEVRAQFELAPGPANLVTVVRGVAPKAVRESVAASAERSNAFRPVPDPDWKQKVRKKAADLIGAPADRVALQRNTTEGVTTVLLNWPLKRGDEILTSSAEHGHFYDTLAYRAARDGVTIKQFHYPAPAPSLKDITNTVERAMTARTRLVMLGQVVLFGQINPVRAIADRVHARGAKLLVDGVLAIGHIPTDVNAMDCDFYAAGFHKFACGPRATSVFYVKPGLSEQLPPLFGRFDQDEQAHQRVRWNSEAMDKYEIFGAHPEWQFMALGETIDFISGIGVSRIQARLFALTSRWMMRARRVDAFRAAVALDPTQCAGLVGCEVAGIERDRVRKLFADRKLQVGYTENYAGFFRIPKDQPRRLFCPNVGIFTSKDDVDRLAEAIEAASKLASSP